MHVISTGAARLWQPKRELKVVYTDRVYCLRLAALPVAIDYIIDSPVSRMYLGPARVTSCGACRCRGAQLGVDVEYRVCRMCVVCGDSTACWAGRGARAHSRLGAAAAGALKRDSGVYDKSVCVRR